MVVAPIEHNVSENHLRVRMSETAAGTETCTLPFVNYDIGVKDRFPL